jgi:hypothetical protein
MAEPTTWLEHHACSRSQPRLTARRTGRQPPTTVQRQRRNVTRPRGRRGNSGVCAPAGRRASAPTGAADVGAASRAASRRRRRSALAVTAGRPRAGRVPWILDRRRTRRDETRQVREPRSQAIGGIVASVSRIGTAGIGGLATRGLNAIRGLPALGARPATATAMPLAQHNTLRWRSPAEIHPARRRPHALVVLD